MFYNEYKQTINQTVRELKSLRGATVQVFGQDTKLDTKEEIEESLYIDTIEVLEDLKEYEITGALKTRILRDGEYVKSDNSYNWESYLYNEINIEEIELNEVMYTILNVHRYGDVRANYTGDILLSLDFTELLYKIDEHIKLTGLEYNGYDIEVTVMPLSNEINIYNEELNIDDYITCIVDIEDIKEYIKDNYNI